MLRKRTMEAKHKVTVLNSIFVKMKIIKKRFKFQDWRLRLSFSFLSGLKTWRVENFVKGFLRIYWNETQDVLNYFPSSDTEFHGQFLRNNIKLILDIKNSPSRMW